MNRRDVLRLGAAALAAPALAGGAVASHSAASRFSADRRFLGTRLGEIAYVARGTGRPALFLHGFPLNGFQWHGAIDRLAHLRRCIVPDFLGTGHSRGANGQHLGPYAQLDMVMTLLEALRVETVDVVANDTGGAVAQLLVAHHPHRVRSLLLTNCETELESPPAAMLPIIELARRGEFVQRRLEPWARNPSLARAEGGISASCYAQAGHPTDEAIRMYVRPLLRPERSAQMHEYTLTLERNVLTGIHSALKASRVPTRIVWGADDTIFSPRSAHYLANSFGNSRGLRLITRAKLFWPEERPATVAEQARLLWESVR